MKQLLKLYFIVSTIILVNLQVNAQSIPDSTMQKIYGFRAFYEQLGHSYPKDSTITEDETEIAGVKSYWFNQNQLTQRSIVIYLHGGAYVYGNIKAYRAMVSHVAASLHLPVLYVEYSLAPEHPFPAANNEVLKVYREIKKKYPGYKIIVIGDSAGGGLAITLVHNAQQNNLVAPDALALISPWVNLKAVNKSYTTRKALDPIITKDFVQSSALLYAGDKLKDADPSEIRFKQFPPVFLMVGTNEILYDDAQNFYNYLKPIQKMTQFKAYQGQTHVWMFTNISSPASVEAMKDIKNFISTNVK